jgi:hypothetical protein
MLWLALLAPLTGRAEPANSSVGAAPAQATLLDKAVESFDIERGNLVQALIKLGTEQHIPMGIEYVDLEAVEKPISVHLGRTTVGQAVGAMLSNLSGYRVRAEGPVLIISHVKTPSGRRNVLNRVLPRLVIKRTLLGFADGEVCLALLHALHPRAKGFVGDLHAERTHRFVGPIELRNVTVRQALNRLVAEYRDAAWAVQVPATQMDGAFWQCRVWTVFQYGPTAPEHESQAIRRNLQPYGAPKAPPR